MKPTFYSDFFFTLWDGCEKISFKIPNRKQILRWTEAQQTEIAPIEQKRPACYNQAMYAIHNCFPCLRPNKPPTQSKTIRHTTLHQPQKTKSASETRPISPQTTPIANPTTVERYKASLAGQLSRHRVSPAPQPEPHTEPSAITKPTPATSRLLIADDTPLCLKCNLRIANQLGFLESRITTCKDLEDAKTAFFEAARAGDPFQYVFSDRDMGNKTDGDTFAKNIREAGFAETQFILISGTLPEEKPFGVNTAIPKDRSLSNDLSDYFNTEAPISDRDQTYIRDISTVSHDNTEQGF